MKLKKSHIEVVKYIIINIFLLIIIYLLYLNNIRICLIYNLFKIPCPGCGLTSSVICLLKGDIIKSLQYNIITIPLMITYSVISIWYIIDKIKGKSTLKKKVEENRKKLIIVSLIILCISYIKNIMNPFLY